MLQKKWSRRSWRRVLTLACAGIMLIVLMAAVMLPKCRNSVMALGNELFTRSEMVNAYLYERFQVPPGTDSSLAMGLSSCVVAAWLLMAFVAQGSGPALGLAFVLAAGQAYLGLSFPGLVNAAIYGLLALAVFGKRNRLSSAGPLIGCILAVCLAAAIVAPQSNQGIEEASEQVRDWLGTAFEQGMTGEGGQESGMMETRHENRRDLLPGDQAAKTGNAYRLVTVEEQQIARPHWIDYLRIILLCLLIPVLLAAPFVPFVWVNRQLRRTAERRACLDADDDRAAVLGAFALVIGYLDAQKIGNGNALYAERLAAHGDQVPDDYAAAYAVGVGVWQEAAYSVHPVSREQRETVMKLLEQTEAVFYDRADWKTRLRLKYVCCLHE